MPAAPRTRASAATSYQGIAERHREDGGDGRAAGQGHRKRAGQAADRFRMSDADEDRQRHLADRDARAREAAPGEEACRGVDAAQRGPCGGDESADDEHALDREAPRQARGDRREHAEEQDRERGEEAGGGGGQAEVVADRREQRREARDDRAEVDREQNDDEQECPARRACGPPGRAARRGRR